MTTTLASTLADLQDALWYMRPRSRTIYEVHDMIAQRYRGRYQWYKWDDESKGYVWSGSSKTLGSKYTTKWTRI